MSVVQMANQPVKLDLHGVDGGGAPVVLSLPLCRSLPVAVSTAMNRDLIALGKRNLTPYQRCKPQLDTLAALAKSAQASKNHGEQSQLLEDRQAILKCLTDSIVSGQADDLAEFAYWLEGRRSVDGLCHEISIRAKNVGGNVAVNELRAVITEVNAGVVLAQLQEVLGEIGDPTAATSDGASTP